MNPPVSMKVLPLSVATTLFALGAVMLVACGGTSGGASSPTVTEPQIAEEWRAKCGNCHRRVEPGTRTRATLEDAWKRHKTRTHLSDEQWAELTDFLASTPATAGPSGSSSPQPK